MCGSRLLEILGRAITVDVADLIWQWFNVIGAGREDGSPQDKQLNKIVELAQSGKNEVAEQQLRLYLFDMPSCCKGRLAAAAIYLQKNLLKNAIVELNSIYFRQPNNTMALYALGFCYERLGRESEAVAFYQDCLKFKNYLQLPRQRLAAIYFKNGQLERAIKEYELLKGEYPDDIPTLVILGHLYIAAARYNEASEIFGMAILIHPDNLNASDDNIENLLADGHIEEALEEIEQLLTENDQRVDLVLKRADLLNMLGACEEALEQYRCAIAMSPGFLEATIKLGTCYLRAGEDRLAAEQFNKAVEINDQIIDAYIGLSIAQMLDKDTTDALTTLSLAGAVAPNSAFLFAQAAILQYKVGLARNAPFADAKNESVDLIEGVILAHQRQIADQTLDPDLHYRLGLLLMSVQRPSDALKQFRFALKLNPVFTRARNNLAVCLYETECQQAAIDMLTEDEPLNKDMVDLHYKTALLYCNRMKFASSLINLERAMRDNFAETNVTVNISIVLQNLGLLDRVAWTWDNLADTTSWAINTQNTN